MRHRKTPIATSLLKNSKAAMFAAIEIHNKPVFPYRYEVCVLLVMNAWELLLKAYIYKYHKKVKLFLKGNKTKPFDECLEFAGASLDKSFAPAYESIKNLYDYRCKIAHFYSENLDLIVFSLLSKNVHYYADFIKKHFDIDLYTESNLILLPIGFKKPFSPVDFLSNQSELKDASKETIQFIQALVDSTSKLIELGIEDSIFVDFKMNLSNIDRVKNADVIAAINNSDLISKTIVVNRIIQGEIQITSNPNAKKVQIKEEYLYQEIFTEEWNDIKHFIKNELPHVKMNKEFNEIMREIKANINLCKVRYLNTKEKKGAKKLYFSKAIYDELRNILNNKIES